MDGTEKALQGVGGVGEVDEHRKGDVGLGKSDPLHAAGDSPEVGKGITDGGGIRIQRQGGGGGLQSVHDGEIARNGTLQTEPRVGRGELEGHPILPPRPHLLGVETGTAPLPCGTDAVGYDRLRTVGVADVVVVDGQRLGEEPAAVAVVGVDHGLAADLKEAPLGGVVVLHGAVEIHVLGGEIGEDPQLKGQRRYPPHPQGVRRDLHDHSRGMGTVRRRVGGHAGEKGVQLGGLGGGHAAVGRAVHPAEERVPRRGTATHRPDQPTGDPRGAEDGVEHGGHAGLAVGARDRHQAEAFGGMAVPPVVQASQSGAGVGDKDQRYTPRVGQSLGGLADNGGSTSGDRLGDMVAGIGVKPVDGDEQVPLGHLAGVRGKALDCDLTEAVGDRDPRFGQKVAKGCGDRM